MARHQTNRNSEPFAARLPGAGGTGLADDAFPGTGLDGPISRMASLFEIHRRFSAQYHRRRNHASKSTNRARGTKSIEIFLQ
jgi:hypothetical protein